MNRSTKYYGGVTITVPPPVTAGPSGGSRAMGSVAMISTTTNGRPIRVVEANQSPLNYYYYQQSNRQNQHQHQYQYQYQNGEYLCGFGSPSVGVRGANSRRTNYSNDGSFDGAYNIGSSGSHSMGSGEQRATLSTLLQVTAAFLVAGFGNVGAGLILDYVKEWPVFLHVDELFIMVPSLLGLKGNLEMTMAARLSTQANLGHMDNANELLKMAKGNLALLQCQATIVSFVVALFASFVKSLTVSMDMSDPLEAAASIQQATSSSFSATTQDSVASALQASSNSMNPSTLVVSGPSSVDQFLSQINGSSTADLLASSVTLAGISAQENAFNDLINMSPSASSLISRSLHPAAAAAASGMAAGLGGSSIVIEQARGTGIDWENALILCASSVLTANIASFVLGSMMILVIVGSYKVRIDPDNVASPVAASFGDMTTAALLAVIAHSIYHYSQAHRSPYLALIITILFLAMLPIWFCVARTNPYTSSVITKGWTPIVIAVFISACGGFILEYGKSRFSRLPVFQPVINGVGGNLVAVQASRLSTSLHKNGKPGQIPANFRLFTRPSELFIAKNRFNDTNLTTARLLLLMSIPAHLLYFFVIRAIEGGSGPSVTVTMTFLSFYMALAVTQVAILLYLSQNLVTLLWRFSIDPDNYSTPLLTATGDLLGCAFLLLVFVIAYQLNDPFASTIV